MVSSLDATNPRTTKENEFIVAVGMFIKTHQV